MFYRKCSLTWLKHRPVTLKIAGSNPVFFVFKFQLSEIKLNYKNCYKIKINLYLKIIRIQE